MNKSQSSFFWNMLQSIVFSFQTVIFLLIVTRKSDLYIAGVYSITYSVSQMFVSVGNYSMRSYQVSDAKNRYSFNTYLGSRLVSIGLMLFFCFVYSRFHGYSREKLIIIALFTVYRVFEALEDVYHAQMQKMNYLDVAARNAFFRIIIASFVFIVLFIMTKNLYLSSGLFAIVSALCFILFNTRIIKRLNLLVKPSFDNVWSLLLACLPICLGTFLYNYLSNSPKYAIDAVLTDDVQTIFNIIYLPVFVVSLLGTFIYNPSIGNMGILWNESKYSDFFRIIKKQILLLIALAVVVLIGGYWMGIPVLSLIYGVDLAEYKNVFMLLLCMGIVVAFDAFGNVVLTVMRKQYIIVIAYGLACGINLAVMNYLVRKYELMGASIAYGISMVVILIIMLVSVLVIFEKKRSQKI